jgi:hypothetical protein
MSFEIGADQKQREREREREKEKQSHCGVVRIMSF